jgi:hypothetical protein
MGGLIMRTIACTFAALLGSSFGSVVRLGIDALGDRFEGAAPPPGPIVANGAVLSSLGVGLVAATLGRGPRLSFWLGAVLGAAGAERFDALLFRRFGIDGDELMARAREAAQRRRFPRGDADEAA